MTREPNKFEEALAVLLDDGYDLLSNHYHEIKEALQIAADSVVPEGVMTAEVLAFKLGLCTEINGMVVAKEKQLLIIENRDRQLLAEANREIERLRESMLKSMQRCDEVTPDPLSEQSIRFDIYHTLKRALETK